MIRRCILGIAAAIGMAFAAPALADEIVITTGAPGGSYHNVLGANLGNILTERGVQVRLADSGGSVDNLDRIASGEAHIGFSQADAFAQWSQRRVGNDVDILGTLGRECVFMATHRDGVDDESDLGTAGVKIAVGEQGSGSAVTWSYLQSLNEDYRQASTYHRGGMLALAQVASGQLDAFMWVTSPENRGHRYFETVMAGGSNLQLIDVDDRSLRGELPNGDSVYELQDVVISEGFVFDTEARVPCTSVMVVASSDLDRQVVEEVATAVMMNGNRIRGL